MQFTTLALSALSIGSALAQGSSDSSTASTDASNTASSTGSKKTDGATAGASPKGMVTVHVVKVGGNNGSLTYTPNNLVAAAGDMVQFQFGPANHTVTQSTFDAPCQPIAMHSNITGAYSGFMPVAAASETIPTYTIMVNNTTPMWIYCSQGKHCQNGMTMVINENTKANASRSLSAYQDLAKKATVNLPGGVVADGTAGSTKGTGSGTSGSPTSGTSSSPSASSSGNSAPKAIRPSEALSLVALFAAGLALLL